MPEPASGKKKADINNNLILTPILKIYYYESR